MPKTVTPSLSARRAWIEIERPTTGTPDQYVALRKESVDRNTNIMESSRAASVALRKESVDRNRHEHCEYILTHVALRKESVDRNYIIKITGTAPRRSLSARRAWIEIRRFRASWSAVLVALRKESVDRNSTFPLSLAASLGRSPQGERG